MLSCSRAFCLTTTGASTTSTGEEGKHTLYLCLGVACCAARNEHVLGCGVCAARTGHVLGCGVLCSKD